MVRLVKGSRAHRTINSRGCTDPREPGRSQAQPYIFGRSAYPVCITPSSFYSSSFSKLRSLRPVTGARIRRCSVSSLTHLHRLQIVHAAEDWCMDVRIGQNTVVCAILGVNMAVHRERPCPGVNYRVPAYGMPNVNVNCRDHDC
jgi:hypothetical protein